MVENTHKANTITNTPIVIRETDTFSKKEICLLQGSWLKNIIIDDKEYWNVEGPINRQVY